MQPHVQSVLPILRPSRYPTILGTRVSSRTLQGKVQLADFFTSMPKAPRTPAQRARRAARDKERYNEDEEFRERTRQHRRNTDGRSVNKRRDIVIDEYFIGKYGRECQNCGHTGPYCHFDWAHWERGDAPKDSKGRRIGFANIVRRFTEEELRAYLDKTRLLCKLCHAEETAQENNAYWAFD